MYRVAQASEYLVITGRGIDDVKLAKKAWILPGQRYVVFDISPVNYSFDVQAMSAEKLPFVLPAVFTIGPRKDDMEALKRFAKLLTCHDKLSNHVKELVQGVIEGETRVLAASMTMEKIFKGTKEFKQEVFGKVQLELDQFGLLIYNANVKQLVDVRGHEYFSYLGQKTQQEAANQAKVDIAEAKFKGDKGAKEKEGLTLQNAARVEAETKVYSKQQEALRKQQEMKLEAETRVYQNLREAEIKEADARLGTKAALWAQEAELAKIQASKNAAIREAELQKEVELRRAATETERLRAAKLAPAIAEYEVAVQAANSGFYERQKVADAALYAQMKEADAKLYARQQEAAGLKAMAEAQATYVRSLLEAFGNNTSAFHDYLLLDRGVYQDMGRINAEAIQGLGPKISVWSSTNSSTTGNNNNNVGAMQEMANVFKTIPPLFSTIKEQTGVSPLPWLATLPPNDQ